MILAACADVDTTDLRAAPTPATGTTQPSTGNPSEPADTDPNDPTDTDDDPSDRTDTDDEPPPPKDDCPDGVVCIDSFPWTEHGTTVGAESLWDAYSCAPTTDESGAEILYRITLDEPGFVALELHDLPVDVDVDVHLLTEADPDTCLDRGHWVAGSWLEPGHYWVAVDTWVDDSGSALDGDYSITFGHTTASDLVDMGIASVVADDALSIYGTAWDWDDTDRFDFTVLDFSLPSFEKRWWTVDMLRGELVFNLHVSHGEGSSDPADAAYVAALSNIPDSHMSSVGLTRTAETYWGSNGYSLRLDGLEPGFNDNVRSRYIVVHGASYATEEYIADVGRAGQSWGCPAVSDDIHEEVVERIQDGSLMLTWFTDADWHGQSAYL